MESCPEGPSSPLYTKPNSHNTLATFRAEARLIAERSVLTRLHECSLAGAEAPDHLQPRSGLTPSNTEALSTAHAANLTKANTHGYEVCPRTSSPETEVPIENGPSLHRQPLIRNTQGMRSQTRAPKYSRPLRNRTPKRSPPRTHRLRSRDPPCEPAPKHAPARRDTVAEPKGQHTRAPKRPRTLAHENLQDNSRSMPSYRSPPHARLHQPVRHTEIDLPTRTPGV